MSIVLDRRVTRPGAHQATRAWQPAASRILDLVIASTIVLLLLPALLIQAMLVAMRCARFRGAPRLGRDGQIFLKYRAVLPRSGLGAMLRIRQLAHAPVWLNVLKGEMAIVGPRPVSPLHSRVRSERAAWRFRVRPGMICLWWLWKRANIDYGSESEVDREFLKRRGLKQDLGILARAVPALLYGRSQATGQEVNILGIRIDNWKMDQAIDAILDRGSTGPATQVCFVNADCANIAYRNENYRRVLNQADFAFADGIGVKLGARMLAQGVRQNLNGTDLFSRLCAALEGSGKGIFLLGARPGVAEAVRDWVARNYPGTEVRGCRHGYFSPAEEPEVLRQIARSKAEILLVAFGAPRQDIWIHQHLRETGATVALGVGGLFDYYSGRIPRAPLWVRELCLEWLFRFWQEPGRLWRRYFIGNGLFMARVLGERLGLVCFDALPNRHYGQRLRPATTQKLAPAAPSAPTLQGTISPPLDLGATSSADTPVESVAV